MIGLQVILVSQTKEPSVPVCFLTLRFDTEKPNQRKQYKIAKTVSWSPALCHS